MPTGESMNRTVAGPDDIDDRPVIAASIWAALDNSLIDETADDTVPEFFAIRGTGVSGEMRVCIVDEDGILLRIYKVTIERCEP
jgi:hypothetical protein